MSLSLLRDTLPMMDIDLEEEGNYAFQEFDLPLLSSLPVENPLPIPTITITGSQPHFSSLKTSNNDDFSFLFNSQNNKKVSEFQQLTGLSNFGLDFGFKSHQGVMDEDVPELNDLPELEEDTFKPFIPSTPTPPSAQTSLLAPPFSIDLNSFIDSHGNLNLDPAALLQVQTQFHQTQSQTLGFSPEAIQSAPISPIEFRGLKVEEEERLRPEPPRSTSEPAKDSKGRFIWANPKNPNSAMLDMITHDPQRYTYPPTDLPAVPLRGLSPFERPSEKKSPVTLKGFEYLEQELEPRIAEMERQMRRLIVSRGQRTLRNTMIDDNQEFPAPATSLNRMIKGIPRSRLNKVG